MKDTQPGLTTMIALRKISLILFTSLTLLTWVLSSPAFAQNKAKSAEGKRTSINFEDQLIEGEAQKPELFYLLQQRNNNFKRLIRLRENFLPEMRKTSEELGRSSRGSGT